VDDCACSPALKTPGSVPRRAEGPGASCVMRRRYGVDRNAIENRVNEQARRCGAGCAGVLITSRGACETDV
jgi:hypothetical protein